MLARKTGVVRPALGHWPVALGEKFDTLATHSGERFAKNHFGRLVRVDIRGVERSDAAVEGRTNGCQGRSLIHLHGVG